MNKKDGYTYLSVLIVVFAAALFAHASWIPDKTTVLRETEKELLFRGEAYRLAISSYYFADPERPSLPRSLDDLVFDPRFAGRRHIRELYIDPVTGSEWLVIYASGGLSGVYSGSLLRPFKRASFLDSQVLFEGSAHYSDWRFEFVVPE